MRTGHITALFSIGRALLYFAILLGIEEMRLWKAFEEGVADAPDY